MIPHKAGREPEPTIDHVSASDTGSRAADDSAVDPDRTSARPASATPAGFETVPSTDRGSTSTPAVPDYELLSELGRGGMGVVFKARHLKLNRIVALKMMHGDDRPGRNEMIRFLAEAEAVAAIKHENVVQVFDFGESDGRPYMALEFCEGGTLARSLHRTPGTPLSADAAARIVLSVCRGVAAAHALGIVHRDIKPANIFLDGRGEPKVADFGLAKRGDASNVTQTDQTMGTPAYMSPEQARGDSKFAGPQADVWSLGVMLYEALTGTRPFRGSVQEILAGVQNAEPLPLCKVSSAVPRDLELIALKCLAKPPHERYFTAKELADDLERHLRGEPISVRPLGPAGRAWKWVNRNRVVSTAAAVTFLALTVGLGLAIGFGREAEQQAQDAKDAASREETEKLAAIAARNDLKAANDRVNRTLATALLNPIGTAKEPPVKPNERMALLKMSELRRESVAEHLLEEAIRTEFATTQLAARSELVLHAAIGLDPRLRDSADRRIVDRLRDPQLPIRVRANLALAFARWSGGNSASTNQVAGVLMELMAAPEWKRLLDVPATRHEYAGILADLAIAMSQLAPRLPPRQARDHCDRFAIAIGETLAPIDLKKEGSGPGLAFVPAVNALAPFLSPEQLESAATWMGKLATDQRFFSDTMAPPLAAFCKRIPPARSAEICDPLALSYADDLAMAQDASEHVRLAAAMRILAPCLGQEASLACMTRLETVIVKSPRNAGGDFAPALQALAPQLTDQQADAVTGRVIQSLPRVKDIPLLIQWMEVVVASATRLTPRQAETHFRSLMTIMLEAESQDLYQHGLRALALRLTPSQAQDVYNLFAPNAAWVDRLTPIGLELLGDRFDTAFALEIGRKFINADKRIYLLGIADAMTLMATRMPVDDAALICEALSARYVEDALKQKGGLPFLVNYAVGIAKLAPWVRAGRVAGPCRELARAILKEMIKTDLGFALHHGATSLSRLAPMYEAAPGDPICHSAALHMVDALVKARQAYDLNAVRELLEGLRKLAPRLAPPHAEEIAISVTEGVLDTLAKKKMDQRINSSFVIGSLAAIAVMLPAERGNSYRVSRCTDLLAVNLDSLVAAPQYDNDSPSLQWVTPQFAPLVAGVIHEDAARARRAAAFAVGAVAASGGRAPFLALFHSDFHPRPRPLPPQQLVDLLKHPFCIGIARRTVLNALEFTYRRPFKDHWEFVEFVQQNELPVDLLSPPTRLEPTP